MRALAPFFLFALVGCSGDDAKEAIAKTVEEPQTLVPAGKAVRQEGIAMSWEGNSVHVGDSWEAAQKLFQEPRGAYLLRSLPQRFGRDFAAHGWETNEGQGFGVITYKDLVVAAVYHSEESESEYADKLLAAQRAGTGTLTMHEVEAGKLKWSYWEDANQRLMVLFDRGKKGIDVTVLMGDSKILDALGATKPVDKNAKTAPFISTPPPRSGSDLPNPGTVPETGA